jgi:hypothetical protein
MRVLHVGAGSLYGGVETLLITLARYRHLCPDMIPEFALCFDGRLEKELISQGVPFHDLGEVRALSGFGLASAPPSETNTRCPPVRCRGVPRNLAPGHLRPHGSACADSAGFLGAQYD